MSWQWKTLTLGIADLVFCLILKLGDCSERLSVSLVSALFLLQVLHRTLAIDCCWSRVPGECRVSSHPHTYFYGKHYSCCTTRISHSYTGQLEHDCSLVLLIVMWSFVCPTKTHSNCSIKSLINERLGSCLPTKLYHFLEHYLFELLDSATSCPHHSLPLYSFHPLVLEFEWARTEDSRGAALAEPRNDHFCLDSGHIWMIYTWQAN